MRIPLPLGMFSIGATCLLLVATAAAQTTSYRLCIDEIDVFPWTFKDGEGLNAILLKMAAEKAGISLEFSRSAWKQCLQDLRTGAKDGAVGASYNDERSQYAAYPSNLGGVDVTRRLMTDDYALYRLKGAKVDWDGHQFLHLTGPIGIQTAYSIGNDIRKLGIPVDEKSATSEELMRRLIKGELQAVSMLANEAYYLLRQPDIADKVEKVARPLVQKPYYVIFNKDFYKANQKTVEALWDAIGVARESSRYKTTERVILEQ